MKRGHRLAHLADTTSHCDDHWSTPHLSSTLMKGSDTIRHQTSIPYRPIHIYCLLQVLGDPWWLLCVSYTTRIGSVSEHYPPWRHTRLHWYLWHNLHHIVQAEFGWYLLQFISIWFDTWGGCVIVYTYTYRRWFCVLSPCTRWSTREGHVGEHSGATVSTRHRWKEGKTSSLTRQIYQLISGTHSLMSSPSEAW